MEKKETMGGILGWIERVGNKLPHPFFLFTYLALFTMIVSWLFSMNGAKVQPPGSKEVLVVKNLFSKEGIEYILTNMLTNFTSFAPLGLVLAMMIGVGLAEKVGLLEYTIRRTISKAPPSLVTYVIVFVGIMGNIASDAATILIPPLAAMIFYKLGRHPIAGLAAGFAAAGAGFTANLLPVGTDALLGGISTEAAKVLDKDLIVTPVANWYFNIVSTILLTIVGGLITTKIIEPRLGEFNTVVNDLEETEDDPKLEKAFKWSMLSGLIYIVLLVVVCLTPNNPLMGKEGFLESALLKGIVPVILFFFLVMGVVFGIVAGRIKNTNDIGGYMSEAMKDLAGYIVLIFSAAQFIAFFQWSNMATWIAVNGAHMLEEIKFTGMPLTMAYVGFTGLLNFLITSGSAKWALEAPVFVPMFMQLGIHPGFTQAAYRIADSSLNIITPLNPYFIVILSFMSKYDKKAGVGTLISLMIPFALLFLLSWIILLLVFYFFNLPLGPGVYYKL